MSSAAPSSHVHCLFHFLTSYINPTFTDARGHKVERWEDSSPLLSISRDTSIATSTSRPQRLRTYRDGLVWLVRCTCSSGLYPERNARARLLAGCCEEGSVQVRRERLCKRLARIHLLLEHGASATIRCRSSSCNHGKVLWQF